MFYDIKERIYDSVVREIMAQSSFDQSREAMDRKAEEFYRHVSWQLYGWIEDEEIVGICGFVVYRDYIEILNIAVAQHAQRKGIGSRMITELWNKYKITIKAETDDDAVDFYRKCGFSTIEISKYNVRRWTCVLDDKQVIS